MTGRNAWPNACCPLTAMVVQLYLVFNHSRDTLCRELALTSCRKQKIFRIKRFGAPYSTSMAIDTVPVDVYAMLVAMVQ